MANGAEEGFCNNHERFPPESFYVVAVGEPAKKRTIAEPETPEKILGVSKQAEEDDLCLQERWDDGNVF